MVKRWLLYSVVLLGCLTFLAAYQGRTAWLLLIAVTLLPSFSMIISLPLMLATKAESRIPDAVAAGDEIPLEIVLTCPIALLPNRCVYQLTHSITGRELTLRSGELLPTDHCGHWACRTQGAEIYDLLGLFRLKRRLPNQVVLIRPKPLHSQPPQELERQLASAWRPKRGGGFSEHHELRLYQPGDALNQIHWKLSAKTGKLIIREAMIPSGSTVLLTVDLNGTPEEVDRKLGRLLWMGQHLLSLSLTFDIQALTGNGIQVWSVSGEEELHGALDGLLCCGPAADGTILKEESAASWRIHIGGEADEA